MDTKELLKKIKRLEIKTKGLTKQVFSGEYHSAFKGRGMAFSEVRDYQLGDEVRTIDWNVTARFNSPFVKVFEEERELSVMFIIDISGSNEFGSIEKSKKELALEIASVISFSAITNNDKVGAIFITDRVEKYIAPSKGRKQVLLILRELIEFIPNHNRTDLSEALKFFRDTQKKRNIVFVISDFIDQNNFIEALKISNKKHDVVAIRLYDEAENTLPKMGLIHLYNAETGMKTWVNSNSKKVQQNYTLDFKNKEIQLLNELKKSNIDFVSISTEDDFIQPLVSLFQKRRR